MRDGAEELGRVSAFAAGTRHSVDVLEADPASDALVRDANVIAFPGIKRLSKNAKVHPLSWVVFGLRRVGEPATSAEIYEAIVDLPMALKPLDQQAVEALLTGDERLETSLGIFQQVQLRGSAAWGFTPTFRLILRCAGFHPVWRSE